MANNWYYQLNGKQLGPVDQDTLGVLAQSGLIAHTTPVWHEGMADWQPAAKVPGLFRTPPPVAAPASTPVKRPTAQMKPAVRRDHEQAPETHRGSARQSARLPAPKAPLPPMLIYGGAGLVALGVLIGCVLTFSGSGKTPDNSKSPEKSASSTASTTKSTAPAVQPAVPAAPTPVQLAQLKHNEQAKLLKEFDELYRAKSGKMAELRDKLEALEKKFDDEMWQADIQARLRTLQRDSEEMAGELVESLGKAGLKKADALDIKGAFAELDKIPTDLQRTLASVRMAYYRKQVEEKALRHFKTADGAAQKLQEEKRFADALRAYDAVAQFGMVEIDRQLQLRRVEIADAEKRGLLPSRDAKVTLEKNKNHYAADLYWGLDGMSGRFDAACKSAILEDPNRALETANLTDFPRSAVFHYVHALVATRRGTDRQIRWHLEHAARLAAKNDAFKSRLLCVEARLILSRPLTQDTLNGVYQKCQEAWVLDAENADAYFMCGVYCLVEAMVQTDRRAAEDFKAKAKEQFSAAARFDPIFGALASEPEKYQYAGAGGNPYLQSVLVISGKSADGSAFGTGFAVKSDGARTYVITNHHVIDGLTALTAVYQFEAVGKVMRRETPRVKVLQVDAANDLALLEVEVESPIKALPLRRTTDGLVVPMKLTIIGHPKGLDFTVVSAELSSASRDVDGKRYLQLSGNIDSGNSGGPVIDENGYVLGVTVAKMAAAGQGLAILTEHVRDLCQKCGVTLELK